MYINSNLLSSLYEGNTQRFLKEGQTIRRQELGELFLPTGSIVANDPLCLFETEPFERQVSPGSYPVTLHILQHNTDQRVAFAELRFSASRPVRFEMALTKGQELSSLKEDEFWGYGVDSGTGAFMDLQTCQKLQALLDAAEDFDFPDLDKALNESYVHTYSVANVTLPDSECNLTAFSSGWGDGSYPCYWGIAEDGEICSLITDFCIIMDEE